MWGKVISIEVRDNILTVCLCDHTQKLFGIVYEILRVAYHGTYGLYLGTLCVLEGSYEGNKIKGSDWNMDLRENINNMICLDL